MDKPEGWFKANADKLILAVLYFSLLGLVIFMVTSKLGDAHVSWLREQSGTVMGGLLLLITGRSKSEPSNRQSDVKPPSQEPQA